MVDNEKKTYTVIEKYGAYLKGYEDGIKGGPIEPVNQFEDENPSIVKVYEKGRMEGKTFREKIRSMCEIMKGGA